MKLPKFHIADQTVVRILRAAQAVESGSVKALTMESGEKSQQPPKGLVRVLDGGQPGTPDVMQQPQQQQQEPAVPGLDESGLDVGMILQGSDSLDAMLGGGN